VTADTWSRPALARDAAREALRLAAVAAVEYAAALLKLEAPRANVVSLADTEKAFLLRCRDAARAAEALDPKDRPRGWDAP
jgi:hypothetical protein